MRLPVVAFPRTRPRWRRFRPLRAEVPSLGLAAVLALAVLAPPAARAGSWSGTMKEQDGVVHVLNPAEGMESPVTVRLEELWRIGGDTDAEGEFFGVLGSVLEDGEGNVYLLDRQLNEIKVFSPEGEYLRTIGREGEGPGEFRRPSGICFAPGGEVGVLQMMPGRIVLLTPQGDPAGTFPLPEGEGTGGFSMLHRAASHDGNLVLSGTSSAFREGKMEQTSYLARVDAEGNEIVRYHERTRTLEFANLVFDEKDMDSFVRRWDVGPEGKVFAVTDFEDYRIPVWTWTGELDRVIEREHVPHRRTKEEMNEAIARFRIDINGRQAEMHASEVDRAVLGVYARDDGTLWVRTSEGDREQPEEALVSLDVFDSEGHYLRRVTLLGEGDLERDGVYFGRDRVFVVRGLFEAARTIMGGAPGEEEEEEADLYAEPLSVVCYRIGEGLAGGE
jgi:hypothetical protein